MSTELVGECFPAGRRERLVLGLFAYGMKAGLVPAFFLPSNMLFR
jgi:hypothetical protein